MKFSNDMNRLRFISLSSEREHNYMMISIDGVVYKYDLSSKEMLFSFKTVRQIFINLSMNIVSLQSYGYL